MRKGLDFKVRVDPKRVAIGEPEKIEELRWARIDNLPQPAHSQTPTFFKKYLSKI